MSIRKNWGLNFSCLVYTNETFLPVPESAGIAADFKLNIEAGRRWQVPEMVSEI
jgi:hypothetical protein